MKRILATLLVLAFALPAFAQSGKSGINNPAVPNSPPIGFAAYNSVSDGNATGDGTTVTVEFNTELWDLGGNFASNTFTAPITGRYKCNTAIQLASLGASHTDIIIDLVTTARTYTWREVVGSQPATIKTINIETAINMTATNTAFMRVTVSGSTKTVTINGSLTDPVTIFSCSPIR